MNYQVLVPVVSQMLGRDISGDVALFFRARTAVGASLNEEGQKFFVKNYRSIVDFMETEAGQDAITTFLEAWAQSQTPKTFGKEKSAGQASSMDLMVLEK